MKGERTMATTETIKSLSKSSEIGDRVVVTTRDGEVCGTVESSELASFFNGVFFVVRLEDGSKFSSLVM